MGQNVFFFENEYVLHVFSLICTDGNSPRESLCKSNHNRFVSLAMFTYQNVLIARI